MTLTHITPPLQSRTTSACNGSTRTSDVASITQNPKMHCTPCNGIFLDENHKKRCLGIILQFIISRMLFHSSRNSSGFRLVPKLIQESWGTWLGFVWFPGRGRKKVQAETKLIILGYKQNNNKTKNKQTKKNNANVGESANSLFSASWFILPCVVTTSVLGNAIMIYITTASQLNISFRFLSCFGLKGRVFDRFYRLVRSQSPFQSKYVALELFLWYFHKGFSLRLGFSFCASFICIGWFIIIDPTKCSKNLQQTDSTQITKGDVEL